MCVEPKYDIMFNGTKKMYSFPKNDTIIIKGGVLSIKNNRTFINYREFNKNKFILLGNPNDSFIYSINTFAYYLAKSTINIGGEIQTHPEKKREYIRLNNKTYKVLSADSNKICLQKLKDSIEIYTAFVPLLQLPNIKFQSILNEKFNLKDLEGKNKLILLTVWATWCSPCIESMPKLDSLANQYKGNLQIVALNYKEGNDKFSKYSINPNILYGRIGDDEYKKLNTTGMPYYALFNNKGELISYHYSIKNCDWITSKFK